MDTTRQIYEQDARGWQRGLYEDVKSTLRAPIVNWIFRTLMANEPELLRHVWFQLKPAFETRAFGEYSVEYRDSILAPIEEAFDLRPYRPAELSLPPAEYRELGGQLTTFDVVAPRLALLFEVMNRSLAGGAVGTDPDPRRSATAPFPEHLDQGRGDPPTMVSVDGVPGAVEATIADVKRTHGLEGGLPSIHRCVAQWPEFLESAWEDLKPVVTSNVYEEVCTDSHGLAEAHVEALPYRPRLAPSDLRATGTDESTVEELRSLFSSFGYGRPTPVLPTLVLYAALRGVAGARSL